MSEVRHATNASGSPDEVRQQLERILASQTLAGSDQLHRLLRMIVERTLSGKPELLKEYNLGLEVFLRPPDYDPKVDPIVRVQARRLRSKLDEYYASEGADDSVVVQIPKGAYVPVFGVREMDPPVSVPVVHSPRPLRRSWMVATALVVLVFAIVALMRMRGDPSTVSSDVRRSVAILPLVMFTEGGNQRHIADQVTEVLTTELAKSRELRVLSRTTASRYGASKLSLPEIARTLGVRWVIEGGVGIEGARAYIKLRCVDSTTDRKVWADAFDCDSSDLVEANTRAAQRIAAAIAAQVRSSGPS